ncbi:MAG: helix-turn-helix domain-containing protein [Candidatus Magasanikbacteria bacterium]|nr:helix-turn-helix domain-containing protein [Candidatus Magasanikbacteria bacterium]
MNFTLELQKIGLHKSETAVYLFLLENGLSTPPQIAKATKIARTNTYNILEELKNKGLVKEQEKGKHKAYLANDPETLLHSIELKKTTLEKIIPDIRAVYSSQKNKPKIRFFENLEQIKEIYLQSLEAEKIMAIGSTKSFSDLMPDFYTFYTGKIKEKGIVFEDILTSPSKLKGAPEQISTLKGLYEAKFLPDKYKDKPTDILIWNDSIAFITLQEPFFGTIITNKLLAENFKMIFEVL